MRVMTVVLGLTGYVLVVFMPWQVPRRAHADWICHLRVNINIPLISIQSFLLYTSSWCHIHPCGGNAFNCQLGTRTLVMGISVDWCRKRCVFQSRPSSCHWPIQAGATEGTNGDSLDLWKRPYSHWTGENWPFCWERFSRTYHFGPQGCECSYFLPRRRTCTMTNNTARLEVTCRPPLSRTIKLRFSLSTWTVSRTLPETRRLKMWRGAAVCLHYFLLPSLTILTLKR